MRPLTLYLFLCLLAVTAACHKTNSHRLPTLYGQWKWVETDWVFGAGSGIVHPGDSTVLLQLDSNSNNFSILINGKSRFANTYQINIDCPAGGCDTTVTFNGQDPSSSFNDFAVSGKYLLNFSHDTLILPSDGPINYAPSFYTLKFVAYP